MSTKSYLMLGENCIDLSYNFLAEWPTSVFTEDDLVVFPEWLHMQIKDCSFDPNVPIDYEGENVSICYAASVAVVRDRLGALGVSLAAARRDFSLGQQQLLKEIHEETESDFAKFKNVIKSCDFDQYLSAVSEILLQNSDHRESSKWPGGLMGFLAESRGIGAELFTEAEYWLRALLAFAEPTLRVAIDITSSYCDEILKLGEPLFDWYSARGRVSVLQTIVLTEGNIDQLILSQSLPLLFPHLQYYYTFLDFDEFKVPGGAGALAGIVKAFAGVRISNRIIAVFDNDTAATSALRNLQQIELPENIRFVRLPDIPLAEKYPTIGLIGGVEMDVNRLAGGIELYLGRDVLENEKGLIPVMWKGYDAAVKQYQGEVSDKALIHKRFKKKIQSCLQSKNLEGDWDGLRRIWRTIITAYEP